MTDMFEPFINDLIVGDFARERTGFIDIISGGSICFVVNNCFGLLNNVHFMVGDDVYSIDVWHPGYGYKICDTHMQRGTVVQLYVDYKLVKQWVCNEDKPKTLEDLIIEYRNLPFGLRQGIGMAVKKTGKAALLLAQSLR